jgi:hypothetical protein
VSTARTSDHGRRRGVAIVAEPFDFVHFTLNPKAQRTRIRGDPLFDGRIRDLLRRPATLAEIDQSFSSILDATARKKGVAALDPRDQTACAHAASARYTVGGDTERPSRRESSSSTS